MTPYTQGEGLLIKGASDKNLHVRLRLDLHLHLRLSIYLKKREQGHIRLPPPRGIKKRVLLPLQRVSVKHVQRIK